MKTKLLKHLSLRATMLATLVLAAISGAWADTATDTYTFTSKEWNATLNGDSANWTSGKAGAGFSNNGIQVTANATGANGTSPISFTNISKIVATYNTNKSAGAGTIVAKIGNNTETSKKWAYSSGDGTSANYTVEWTYDTPQTGNVKITCNTTKNSIYLVSVAITYEADSRTATTTAIDAAGITNTNIYAGTAAGTLSASVTAGESAVAGATVTWASSAESVATVDEDGIVTLVSEGSTTITASYAGDATYQPSSASYVLTVTNTDPELGTVTKPYTVAQAKAKIDAGTGTTGVYVKGIVCTGGSNLSSGKLNYWISDDGTTTDRLEAYKGLGLDEAEFTATTDIQVGDIVTIYGNLTKYSSTYEFAEGSYITSFKRKTLPELSFGETTAFTVLPLSSFVAPTLTNPEDVTVTYSSSNTSVAEVNSTTGAVTIGSTEGTTTITASFAGDDDYKENSATYTITVQKGDADLAFDATSFVLSTSATSFVAPSLTNPHSLAITYSSSNEDVATVDGEGAITLKQTAGNTTITATATGNTQYNGGTATYTISVTEAAIYTATFMVNGVKLSEQEAAEETTFTFPTSVESLGGKAFLGWSKTEADPALVNTATETMSANTTYYAVWGDNGEKKDELDRAFTGVTSTSYSDWSGKTATSSSAVYAGNSAGGNSSIQLRSDKSTSGVITTTSGGKATKVKLTWNSGTANGRTVDVYCKGSKYTAASDLYAAATQGTKVGSIVYGTSTELTIPNDYAYVGLRSNSGALYLDKIEIVWSTGSSNLTTTVSPVNISISSDYSYATFASATALDFTGKDVTAYIAKTKGDGTGVTFQQVNKVPANTGVLLYKAGGADLEIPALVGDAEDVTDNVFVPGTGAGVATDDGTNYNYILNNVGGKLGFYKAAGKIVANDKAYISIPQSESAAVKGFIALPGFEDETGIHEMVNGTSVNGKWYNLSVNRAQKGIFIVNGKKVVK